MSLLVSVVVPTCRRDELLNRCLAALILQDGDASAYEVIVVDDGASEETRRLVELWANRVKVDLRYARNTEGKGPASARNTGWRIARADIIAFTDDDCAPDRGWLREGLSAVTNGADGAWGRLIMPLPKVPTDYERDASRLTRAEFVTANCFCRRAALERTGGFDERFTAAWREDSDLLFSLLEHDGRLVHAPGAIVVHPIRPARWGVSVAQQRKNMYNALLYKKHPKLYRERIQAEPPWHYYAAVASLLLGFGAAAGGAGTLAWCVLAAWVLLTIHFCRRRLHETSHAPWHIVEMVVTSVLIPPLAVFWRLYGAIRYRVFFL